MADHNSGSATCQAPASSPDDSSHADGADDEDPLSENPDCFEETVMIELTAPPEEMWYHGRLGRQVTEDRLRAAGEVGSYLVRESESSNGNFVLSYLGKNGLTHFRISAICGDYYLGGRRFDTLALLVGYYTSVSYLLKGEQLRIPVPPPEPVDDRRKVIAVYPFSKMPETDELSFEKGEIFTVINERGDDGWLWVKSQNTGEAGIIHEELVETLNDNIDPDQSLSYFHANITKEEALEKLRHVGQGSFLVRLSENSPGNYSLFVLCDKTVQRFRIEKQGRQLFMGGRYFDSLDAVIERYKKEEIVEGFTLKTPVKRDRRDIMDAIDGFSHRGSAEDIYASIRQSSRGPVTGRSNRFDLTGFLHIRKSQKTKKWKTMFFVLLGHDNQLCYLENEKRTRPKGLIDLAYSSLYPVHDSYFGRPNCFQLVTNAKAYNHFQTFYLCAENSDLAQRWMNALKPYCVNTQPPTRVLKAAAVLKELRTLTIEVVDGRQLATKLLPHPYCVVLLNNVKVCKSQVGEGSNPVWEEKFILDDIPCEIESFQIGVYNQSKRSRDPEIAQVTVPLIELKDTDCLDKWHCLHPANSTIKGDMGSLRIRARYLHEIIMPEEKYSTLKELILNGDLSNILELFNICNTDRIPLAKSLLQIFRHEKQENVILKTMNDFEIAREEGVPTLFRATSLATTLMDQYMKMTASKFVSNAIKDCILRILDSKQSCELNPDNLDNCNDVSSNADHLLHHLNDVLESIFRTNESCPIVLRYICGCLQRSVSAKWPGDDSVRTRVVSGFIFLRLLCPAILNPKSFNLITETPSETASRALKLIAKSLQNLANLVEFGAKESFMAVINPFIIKNKSRMVKFLDELSDVKDIEEHDRNGAIGDLSRDLATVHQICASHLEELKRLSETKPSLKKLVAVTIILTDHKKRYMGDT